MVPLIIVYLHSRRQLLLRGGRIGGHFFGKNKGLCAPSFRDGPPTSTSFLESSSTEKVRRSASRAGLRVGDSHQPQMSDASILPQRLYGTCQWWRCWLSVTTQTPVLPADKLRRPCQGLAVSLELLLTDRPGHPLLVNSALQARPTLELRKPVYLWDAGGGRQTPRVFVPFRSPLAHYLCSRWGQGAQVGDAAVHLGLPGAANLSRGPAALPPAVAPVHAPAVLALSVAPRASPPALLLSPKPHTPRGSRGMAGALDLVLEVDSGVKHRGYSSAVSSSGTALRRAASTCSVAGGCQLWRVSPPPSVVPTGTRWSESVARSAHSPGPVQRARPHSLPHPVMASVANTGRLSSYRTITGTEGKRHGKSPPISTSL
jgi:hypothetical protein